MSDLTAQRAVSKRGNACVCGMKRHFLFVGFAGDGGLLVV